MKRQTFDVFQFNPERDSVAGLNGQDLKALIGVVAERTLGTVTAFHVKRSIESLTTLDDSADLEAVAIELIELLEDKKPFYVLRMGSEVTEANDLTLEQLFGRAVAMGVAANLGLSTMTIGGQRTPVKPPSVSYKQVSSSSRPGHVHTVELLGGVPIKCSCEGFYFSNEKNPGNGQCKHLKMALRD